MTIRKSPLQKKGKKKENHLCNHHSNKLMKVRPINGFQCSGCIFDEEQDIYSLKVSPLRLLTPEGKMNGHCTVEKPARR